MVFATPALLLALAALPLLWWLLRVTPPAPRRQDFPAIGLLLGLQAHEETAARTPPWVLLLRMAAAALLIVGLAGPILDAAGALPGAGNGSLLLVVDDGWAAAPDWVARERAAGAVLDRAEREGRRVSLLTTARTDADEAPRATPATPAPELRPLLAALRPKPWPPSRTEAADAARRSGAAASVWIADGLASPGDARLSASLAALGPVEVIRSEAAQAWVMRAPRSLPDRLVARLSALPQPAARSFAVLAQTGDGRTLARADGLVAPGADAAEAEIALPTELRNQLARLTLAGVPSASAVTLLDEGSRRRPVGLVASGRGDDEPLVGPLYYVKRALDAEADVTEGNLKALLAQPLAVIVLADQTLEGEDAAALVRWVEHGGLLLRFAGPRLAAATDDPGGRDGLLPVPLLAGDRRLGGALSWTEPAHLAPFPAGSPFAGLAVPAEVAVSRQVLAEPSVQVAGRTWAALTDGTPLVTAETRGAGRIVLFHVTANAEWSDLPLSGLFPEMLRRLVALSAGVETPPGNAVLAPNQVLDGFGEPGPAPPAATGLAADRFAQTMPSPRHPPGFYGSPSSQQALNLGTAVAAPEPLALPEDAQVQPLTAEGRERPLGGPLIAAALALLALDLLISLGLRGLLRASAAAGVVLLALLAPAARAATSDSPALTTRLAYVVTGNGTVDQVSRAGLTGLSSYVNQHTAAALGPPSGVVPGQDDLSYYPLLYWPVVAGATLAPPAVEALNAFMSHGGILLVDTRGGSGSGEGFAPGGDAALRRVAGPGGLSVPALAPLTDEHVLAHAFYLLRDFPGRYDGGTIWVARDDDLGNDSVSPVVIGGNDWAAAWAVDAAGDHPYATIPGGDRQRTLAYRFGVNLVMYALTGNYKGDQVHVPAILERLGQ